MTNTFNQQLIISGVGGQGVLFITRLLAEAAIYKHLHVFTSETHGMAQRGGTVISHLKVGNFNSPLIRPAEADGILALKAENMAQHGAFLKPGAWAAVNSPKSIDGNGTITTFCVDADTIARNIHNLRAVNLIMLGFTLSSVKQDTEGQNHLFCSFEDIFTVVKARLAHRKEMLNASLKALEAGYNRSS
jgi:indolepyruvate ferredoxin oxidoreductase beta subunit